MQKKPRKLHGGDIYRHPDVIDFSVNTNPLGTPESVKRAVQESVAKIEHYPDVRCEALREAISRFEQVNMEEILCGNGAAELFFAAVQAVWPQKALVIAPSFSEYEEALRSVGAEVEYYYLCEEDNFQIREDYVDKLSEEIDMIFLCNPNNPTSSALNTEEISKILAHCKKHNIFVMIDETYVEFAPDIQKISAVSLTTKFDNFMVLRGTSKFFCAPGLRLGYGICGNLSFLERMNSIKNPWTINTLAALAGEAMFMDKDYIKMTKDYIDSERSRCMNILSKRPNLKVFKAYANFILVKLLDGTTSFEMFERCIKEGLMIRDCASFHGLDGEFIRFCIQKKEDNDRLLALLK